MANNTNNNLVKILLNPFTDQVKISAQSKNSFNIRISDITGKTYYQNDMLESVADINTTGWPKGVYFVVCTNPQGVSECKKLIKQ